MREFELWVVGNLQAVLDSDDSEAITAFDQVDVLLVQIGDDVIDSQEFAQTLLDIVLQQARTVAMSALVYVSSDDITWSHGHFPSDQPLESEDTRLLVELA